MPPPSPLAIATGVVTRLVKEETSYHHELEQQQTSIAKLEAGEGAADENAEYVLRQQVCSVQRGGRVTKAKCEVHRDEIGVTFMTSSYACYHPWPRHATVADCAHFFYSQRKALEETKAIFPQQKQKIQDALAKLEQQLVSRDRESWTLMGIFGLELV